VEDVQKGWSDLTMRVSQLEAQNSLLTQENKTLRFQLEKVIEHRQKSHSELVLILTGLVGKLPLNDVGVIVSKLVEHNSNVSHFLAALVKGATEGTLPQPTVLKDLEHAKRDLQAALKPVVEELVMMDTPFETDLLQALLKEPDVFFSPRMVRANRCYLKGQVPRERVVKEFGEPALALFNDLTTDPKLNPHPKAEEIVLCLKNDFEQLLPATPGIAPDKQKDLLALSQRIQRSKANTEQARAQRNAFQKMSFIVELLHYYENQNTEAPDVIFAQRLPALVEQFVVTNPQEGLDEKMISQAEALLAYIINPDHRLMVINNMGKGGGVAKSLKYVLRLRAERAPDPAQSIPEIVKHFIPPPPEKAPSADALAPILKLVPDTAQRLIVLGIMSSDRLRTVEAEALGRSLAGALGMKGLDEQIKAQETIPPEVERQLAWTKVKDLINRRSDPGAVASAIRERLHAKYDADEIRQSWLTLIESEPISLIRVFCQIPYLADGRTDSIARPVMETYVTRLTHEKYTAVYNKIVNSLRNMFRAKPDSPTLLNFTALVRWVDPAAADKLCADIGMQAAVH